ncbi:hypothetical protein [Aminobacter sp. AP02]|uniref:hypothetical protein n=1 Tax=Aminobacter sp. AP02 TaxID=2135737 RepID=UPI001FDF2190|nr:hypothetical protein [Aminobacter sp. AP02]
MTAEGRDTFAQQSCVAQADIIDADFEVVAPSHTPGESPADQPVFARYAADAGGMEMLRSACMAGVKPRGRGGPVLWVAGISLAAMVFWVSGGHAIVRAAGFPPSWQARQLQITDVISRIDSSGHKPVLLVDGAAFNDGRSPVSLPPIDIAVVGNDGKILRYRLGTGAAAVAPGARWAFSSRLDVPMNGIKTVTVAFSE